jgi:hypothetical protein
MERMADRMVWSRLATDSDYNNAENAEDQSAREDEISEQVWTELTAKYGSQ